MTYATLNRHLNRMARILAGIETDLSCPRCRKGTMIETGNQWEFKDRRCDSCSLQYLQNHRHRYQQLIEIDYYDRRSALVYQIQWSLENGKFHTELSTFHADEYGDNTYDRVGKDIDLGFCPSFNVRISHLQKLTMLT